MNLGTGQHAVSEDDANLGGAGTGRGDEDALDQRTGETVGVGHGVGLLCALCRLCAVQREQALHGPAQQLERRGRGTGQGVGTAIRARIAVAASTVALHAVMGAVLPFVAGALHDPVEGVHLLR